ncbi:outer membrane beta-barrel protein [Aliivibrio sp. S2TY2]|uniref:outer membrane beta-barrel protein n=1 Tax=unclassified Aliivibrio TaxID=2645654 RepID=UPI00237916F4|nr:MULTISPECIES: outer membrane beta-barrel protein [unclassified Aliivibrio]MDD9174983.1 outer membrane beta-barrel protein [Aliivibrio sp. S3TY1]MDD9192070.1 outer membrane beta-barrel protein [Aliivibrio sp. S2TY2]
MKTLTKALITTTLLSASSGVYANEKSHGYITESGLKITPLFEMALENNDNIGRYSSSQQPESSDILRVKPGVVVESDRNGNQYQVLYQMDSGSYFNSHDDDYLDHLFMTNNFVQINQRSGIGFNYTYLYEHEERGTGIFAGDQFSTIASKPVEYSLHNANLTHVYGAENAKGRIESNLKYEKKTYQNYRNLSSPNDVFSSKFNDYDEFGGGMAFYYNIRPATELLLEVDLADRRYRLSDPFNKQSQDDLNAYYLIGTKWDITGKTSGRLRLGLQNKKYKNHNTEDFNGFSWDLNVTWKPLDYSTINVSASQRAENPDQGANYINKTRFNGAWKHYWQTHFYSSINVALINDDYSSSSRQDDLVETALIFGYELRDYAEITAGWRYEDNDSSITTNTYTQNVWYIATSLIF